MVFAQQLFEGLRAQGNGSNPMRERRSVIAGAAISLFISLETRSIKARGMPTGPNSPNQAS